MELVRVPVCVRVGIYVREFVPVLSPDWLCDEGREELNSNEEWAQELKSERARKIHAVN